MKIVFDTNVILSAFLTQGLSHKVFEKCLREHDIYVSDFILNEIDKILKRKFDVPVSITREVIKFIKNNLILYKPKGQLPEICKDKDDNNILVLADEIKADFIITGDSDLLSLEKYRKTLIIKPREFYEKFLTK